MSGLDERLAAAVAAKKVVVVAGAGVSIGATWRPDDKPHPCASWEGLIRNGIDELDKHPGDKKSYVTSARAMVEGGRLEDAAGEIFNGLGTYYPDWLRTCFDSRSSFQVNYPDVPKALDALGLPIFTTNYDDVLEHVSGRIPLLWSNDEAWRQATDRPKHFVLHIHGAVTDSKSVIFSKQSYLDLLNSDTSQAFWRSIATDYSLLFVGLRGSFEDPNFQRLRAYLEKVLNAAGPEHYRLVYMGETTEEDRKQLEKQKIGEIVYGDKHSDLAGFLSRYAPSAVSERVDDPKPPPEAVLEVDVQRDNISASLSLGKENIGRTGNLRHGLTQTTLETISLFDRWIRQDPIALVGNSTGSLAAGRLGGAGAVEPDTRSRVVQQIGRILFEAVFKGEVLELLTKGFRLRDPRQRATMVGRPSDNVKVSLVIKLIVDSDLRVVLFEGDDIDLGDLPWELLWNKDGRLSAADRVTLVRSLRVQDDGPWGPKDGLTILIALAQPTKLIRQPLRVGTASTPAVDQEDYQEVIKGIYDAIGPDADRKNGSQTGNESRIHLLRLDREERKDDNGEKVETTAPVTWERFQAAFDPNQAGYVHIDVVHFIGHSGAINGPRPRSIAFEKSSDGQQEGRAQTGEIGWVSFDDVHKFFLELNEEDRPTLVVLHLCRGGVSSSDQLDLSKASFSPLGLRLLEAHIPLVVAMQYPMWPDIGKEFTSLFYREVDKMTVDQAVQTARRGLRGKDWVGQGGPILFMHGGIRQILAPRAAQPVAESPADPRLPDVKKQQPAKISDREIESTGTPSLTPTPIGGKGDGID